MRKIFFISLVSIIFLSGCTSKVLLPYEDSSRCSKGENSGICERVSTLEELPTQEDKIQIVDTNTTINIKISHKNNEVQHYDYTLLSKQKDKYALLFIYPYTDAQNARHSKQSIIFKVKEGEWLDTDKLPSLNQNTLTGVN